MTRSRVLGALFVAYLAATFAHVAFVVAHEPFSFDAWNVAVDTHSEPITASRFFDYWQHQYMHGNPRLGQPFAYLSYKISGFAEVMTPLAFLGLTLGITVLGIGRVPRRPRDFALWAIAIGFCWFALPQIGRNMFSRAYGTNYIYGAAIQIGVLAALRLHIRANVRATLEPVATYAMLGALAGMCNEHTGPALIAFLLGYAIWRKRHAEEPRVVAACGAGATVGFLTIFLAPGQDERYAGLAQRMGLVERIFDRGLAGGLDLAGDYLAHAAPLLVVLVLVLLQKRVSDRAERAPDDRAERTPGDRAERAPDDRAERTPDDRAERTPDDRAERESEARADERTERTSGRFVLVALGAGIVIVATLCASPKLGSRFFIAPMALLLAATLGVLDEYLASHRRLLGLVAVAVLVSIYAAARTMPLFREVGAQGDARMTALAALSPGDSYIAEPFAQVGESWWFIGDDFRDPKKRTMVASYLGLAQVTLHERRSRSLAPPKPR